MRELKLLDALWEIITPVTGPGALGPGDDAALVPLKGAAVVSVDQTVSGVHTDPRFVSAEDFGWRAVATALSDLAAMGCSAKAVLIALTYPPNTSSNELRSFAEGANAAAAEAGARIYGGDISSGPAMAATVTVIGEAPEGADPVQRGGAKVGDLVGVTGQLGGSAGGLALLQANSNSEDGARYRRPQALITEGQQLAAAGVTAMIDISDGLATDARHLGEASGALIEIDLAQVPIDPICERAAELADRDPVELAATGGEDFELLFTAPEAARDTIDQALECRVTWIGKIVEGEAGTNLADLGLQGWQH